MTKITMTYDFYRKENEVKHFQTEVELRSFVIRFQNVAKRLNKIPYFVISKNMKQLEYYLISVKY